MYHICVSCELSLTYSLQFLIAFKLCISSFNDVRCDYTSLLFLAFWSTPYFKRDFKKISSMVTKQV